MAARFLAALALASTPTDALPTVRSSVHRTAGTVDLVIELTQTTESSLGSIKDEALASRTRWLPERYWRGGDWQRGHVLSYVSSNGWKSIDTWLLKSDLVPPSIRPTSTCNLL